MAEPSPFEKRFASRLVQTGRMSREQVLAYFRQRNSDPGTTNAPTLPRLDQYLVGVGALTAGEVDSIVRQLEEGSRTVVQDNPMIGKVLAGYRVVELVGAGGMGELYRAHDPSLDKDFAIKVISPAAARNPNYVRRLQQEAKLASRIDDPHLVPILKLGEEGGQVFCVMPFIEGRNVADHVRERGGLPLPEALAIVEQAARGLAAIHRAGIIHRDVKPENLLIGPDGRVRLTDFGLARDLNSDSSLTATGQLLGTPYYMSPEQATGIGVDERTDIYSLGLTFYFLLAGRPPFEGTSPLSVLDKHRREPLPDPAVANPGARGEPIKLLRRMTAKDPGERPRSMDEVIADLETLRAHGRIRGPRRNFALPGPRVLGAAGALSLAGAAILVAFALAGGPPDPEPTPDPVPDSVRNPDSETADPEALAHALLEEAERLRAEHGREPRNLPRILAAFRQVIAADPASEAARTSRMVITGLEIELERAYAWRLAQIDREVHPRIEQIEIRPALHLFEDAAREFDDPGWLDRVEAKRTAVVAELTVRIDAEIAERRRMLPEESFREIVSTHQRIRHALSRDALELLGPETAARLERELEAMAEAVEQELSKRAATWREWVERLRGGERLEIPELVLLRAGLEEAREHPKAPPGIPEILERIESQLTQLRAEAMQRLYEAVLRDDRDAARHHFREVLSTIPSTDRIRPPRETSEVDRFLDILRRDRQAMWAALRARDGASFEKAAAVWHERETTHPERALVPARLGWTPPDYPYPAELEPIAICATFQRRLAEFWARFDDRRLRVVHFRAIGEPARRKRVVQKTDEGPLAWRLHGEPTSSRRIFDPLRTIEPADLLAIYLGDSLEAEAASEAIPPTEAFAAAVIMLYLDRIDEARAIAKAGRDADPDRPWPRLEAWLALAEGSRPGGEEPDPPRDVESAVRDAFGRHAQVVGREGDLVHVRISYDFEDPQQLLHLIRSPTSKASIEHGHLHLQDEDRGGIGTSILRLRGEWRGDLAFEIVLKPEESSRPFRLCVVYLLAREENSMRIERSIEAGIRANPKGAEVFLQTVRSGRDSIAPIGRSVEASFEAGRYYRLQGRVQGNRHELDLADRDGNRPGISTDGDAEPVPAGEIEIVWTNREFWVDSLRIEGRVSIESLTR